MSIATAITAAQGSVANAYTAVSNMGGTLPATQNLTNLPTAIESIPGPDIVTATNTTGTAIASGDKVWLEKVAGGWNIVKYGSSISLLNDINTVGSPTISSDYVVSGFSSSNYLQGSSSEAIDGFDTLHCTSIIKFNTGTLSSSNSLLIAPNFCPTLQLAQSLKYWNGSSLQGFLSLQANTDYWIKTEVASASSIKFSYSLDGQTYTEVTTGSSTEMTSSNTVACGNIGYASYANRPFSGTIDLKELKVFNANGVLVWQAVKDNIFTGFAEESIASSGTGQVKTALGGYVTVEVTADANDAEITVA